MSRFFSGFLAASLSISASLAQSNKGLEIGPGSNGLRVSLNPASGAYAVRSDAFDWNLTGQLGAPAEHAMTHNGRDSVGRYAEIDFMWRPGTSVTCTIRKYDDTPVVWFRAHYDHPMNGSGVKFPYFNSIPIGLNAFSYQDRTFSPPTFGLAKTATPWLLFDGNAHSLVLSPASNFMLAAMTGTGSSEIGVEMANHLTRVPEGFNQDAVMVISSGIGATWDTWGATMRALFHKNTPANDADPTLKAFGYWTDNGADYYYNYDNTFGYAGTLVNLVDRYREEGIPLGYLQLDSWWYQKSTFDPAGHAGGAKKNNRLPIGSWNRYGGLMEYRAHPDLFPDGLSKFQQRVGLPLVVHNRWIDRTSPYHEQYKISGVAAVDPKWWKDIADYLKQSGVVCYEQDWLDQIYLNSPDMASNPGLGDAFTAGMAAASRSDGLSMHYCMGSPRFFLQGLNYSNLTTIRTSGDRFEPRKWADFLYVSRLAHDVGIWPWCDVFKSAETGNMILSVLSAGPVGTGDALGRENKENIFKAVRADGVIIKPDQPLMPTDQTYIDGAAKSQSPFVATTFTDHNGIRTRYLFAFPRSKGVNRGSIRLRDLGVSATSYVMDMLYGHGRFVEPDDWMPLQIGKEGFTYLMIAPAIRPGFAFLGDTSKFVPTGKQRIASIMPNASGFRILVRFAPSESSVTLRCASRVQFAVKGSEEIVQGTGVPECYSFKVKPKQGKRTAEFILDFP